MERVVLFESNYHGDRVMAWMEAACLLDSGQRQIITTPRLSYVPHPPSDDHYTPASITLCRYHDGRFGAHEPGSWPQFYSERYPHLPCIPSRERNQLLSDLWYTLVDEDLQRETGGLFRVRPTMVLRLRKLLSAPTVTYDAEASDSDLRRQMAPLVLAARHALVRMDWCPSDVGDLACLWAEAQRYILDIYGMLNLHQQIRSRAHPASPLGDTLPWVGCFTTDPKVLERLHAYGVPVWWVADRAKFPHDTKIRRVVPHAIPPPPSLCPPGPSATRHVAGIEYLAHIHEWATYHVIWTDDHLLGPRPTGSSNVRGGDDAKSDESREPSSGPVRTVKARKDDSVKAPPVSQEELHIARQRFAPDLPESPLPPLLPVWQRSLADSRMYFDDHFRSPDTSFFAPDPVSVKAPLSRPMKSTVEGWLLTRSAWRSVMSIEHSTVHPPAYKRMIWIQLLDRGFVHKLTGARELNVQRNKQLDRAATDSRQILGRYYQSRSPPTVSLSSVEWMGSSQPFDRFFAGTGLQQVLWEWANLNFRAELRYLDRRLAVAPGGQGAEFAAARNNLLLDCCASRSTLPQFGVDDLAANDFDQRWGYVYGLGRVMWRWRWKGEDILTPWIRYALQRQSELDMIQKEQLEHEIIRSYCRIFVIVLNRAPVCPRTWPGGDCNQ